jgi:hypothetical protein
MIGRREGWPAGNSAALRDARVRNRLAPPGSIPGISTKDLNGIGNCSVLAFRMINTKLTTVTPRMASEMLKSNTSNRKIRMAHVNRLKTEILAGRWLITHQGIAFADDDSLIDGQHRLMAIEASGKSVQIMVSHGVPKFHNGDINLNTMDVIDCGKARSTADQLHLLHGVKNVNITVGALNMISKQFLNVGKFLGSLSVGQANEMLELYGDGIGAIMEKVVGKISRRSAIIAALAVGYRIAPEPAVKFADQLTSGNGIGSGDPVYALRESLISYPVTGYEVDRNNLFLRTAQALYNTIQEVPIKTAKVSRIGLEYFMSQDKTATAKVKAIMLGEKI